MVTFGTASAGHGYGSSGSGHVMDKWRRAKLEQDRKEMARKYLERDKKWRHDFVSVIKALTKLQRGDLLFKIYDYFMGMIGIPIGSTAWINRIKVEPSISQQEALCKLGARTAKEQAKLLKVCDKRGLFNKGETGPTLWTEAGLNAMRENGILSMYGYLAAQEKRNLDSLWEFMDNYVVQGYKRALSGHYTTANFPDYQTKEFIHLMGKLPHDEAYALCTNLLKGSKAGLTTCESYHRPPPPSISPSSFSFQ